MTTKDKIIKKNKIYEINPPYIIKIPKTIQEKLRWKKIK